MPRKQLIRSNIHPYHLTARCNNKEPFHCSLEQVWNIIGEHLNEISTVDHARIHAFVLMPNHFHLLISTPEVDLGIIMQKFMASVTKSLNHKCRRSGRVFGARYHWSLINTVHYFDYALKYVYRNPVKASLVKNVEDYSFSSIRYKLGMESLQFPLYPIAGFHSLVPHDQLKWLQWINEPFKNELDETIRKGLKRTLFSPPKKGHHRKQILLSRNDAADITKLSDTY